MVKHRSLVIVRKDCTITRTLCGRTNAASRDGMNIADDDAGVTCKFCLNKMAHEAAAKARKEESVENH